MQMNPYRPFTFVEGDRHPSLEDLEERSRNRRNEIYDTVNKSIASSIVAHIVEVTSRAAHFNHIKEESKNGS